MLTNLLLALLMLSNFILVGSDRISRFIQIATFQGVLLGVLLLIQHGELKYYIVLMALAAIAIKGVAIPIMLVRAHQQVKGQRRVTPYLGMTTSLVLCAFGTGASVIAARKLPLPPEMQGSLFVPAALATAFTGFLFLAAKRKILTQIVGYLTLENSIFLFGLLLARQMPLLVEAGVLLDLVVGIFVMAVVVNHIYVVFDTLDTRRLVALKD